MPRESAKKRLKEKIAGEITLSPEPGRTIRKWRESFGINQHELCQELATSASVVSDYESGRRKSPGIATIKKIVDALVAIDEEHGGKMLQRYAMSDSLEAVLARNEFSRVVRASRFIEAIKGRNLAKKASVNKSIYGYTVVDSMLAIKTMSSFDYLKLYGWSSERALIFTGVKYGRSAMVAIRTHPLRPAMVIYTRPERVDELAVKLAELEDIPLVVTDLSHQEVISSLKKLEEELLSSE